MANNTAVGMMDDAYFVGRKAILGWLNDLCSLNVKKIEETASGAIACQVMDALFPGKVPMQKLNWGAKADYEYIQNYKILQNVFKKMSIEKDIKVNELIRGKYQDNLEFMQWLKKFSEMNSRDGIQDYDPVARRNKGKGVHLFKAAQGPAAPKSSSASVKTTSRAVTRKATGSFPKSRSQTSSKPLTKSPDEKENKSSNLGSRSRVAAGGVNSAGMKKAAAEIESLKGKLEKAVFENTEHKHQADILERERDFYFGKLRDVEVLLQNYDGPDESIVRSVLKLLYATEDDVTGEAALAAAEAAIAATEEEPKEGKGGAAVEGSEKKNMKETKIQEVVVPETEETF